SRRECRLEASWSLRVCSTLATSVLNAFAGDIGMPLRVSESAFIARWALCDWTPQCASWGCSAPTERVPCSRRVLRSVGWGTREPYTSLWERLFDDRTASSAGGMASV